jgi:hypothetical protein
MSSAGTVIVDSETRSARPWLPAIAGLVAGAAAVWWMRPEAGRVYSPIGGTFRALWQVLVVSTVAGTTAWAPRRHCGKSVDPRGVATHTSAATVWFAPLTLPVLARSPWSIAVMVAVTVAVTDLLRRYWPRRTAVAATEPPLPFPMVAPRPARALIPALVAGFCVEFALAFGIARDYGAGGLFASIAAGLVTWHWSAIALRPAGNWWRAC